MRASERHLRDFVPQGISNAAWALATSILADELLFGKLAKGGLVKIGIKNNEIDLQIIERENILISKKKVALLPAK